MPVTIPVCHRKSSISELYALMLSIRLFEQSLLDMFNQGILMGTTHTCIGQESTAVGVLSALDLEKDIVFSNHRGHGHFLSYCGKVEELYLEIMGKIWEVYVVVVEEASICVIVIIILMVFKEGLSLLPVVWLWRRSLRGQRPYLWCF